MVDNIISSDNKVDNNDNIVTTPIIVSDICNNIINNHFHYLCEGGLHILFTHISNNYNDCNYYNNIINKYGNSLIKINKKMINTIIEVITTHINNVNKVDYNKLYDELYNVSLNNIELCNDSINYVNNIWHNQLLSNTYCCNMYCGFIDTKQLFSLFNNSINYRLQYNSNHANKCCFIKFIQNNTDAANILNNILDDSKLTQMNWPVLLMHDYTKTDNINTSNIDKNNKNNIVCIELKPKWGFLPNSPYINGDNIKHKYCRYCMHQQLKLNKGKIASVSSFCPLNLYSNNYNRIHHSLQALLHNPQNNIKIFAQYNPNLKTHQNIQFNDTNQVSYLCKLMNNNITLDGIDSNNMLTSIVDMLSVIVSDKRIQQLLYRISCIQRQFDPLDIEYIYPLYNHFINKYPQDPINLERKMWPYYYSNTHNLMHTFINGTQQTSAECNQQLLCASGNFTENNGGSVRTDCNKSNVNCTTKGNCIDFSSLLHPEQYYELFCNYLISHTAKDISIMITCQFDNSANKYDITAVGVVDLDRKFVGKIPKYFQLDQDIVTNFRNQLQSKSSTS